MISSPNFDTFDSFKDFILLEELAVPEEKKWRPIISVKGNNQKIYSIQNQNRKRTAWHFLTLGIPLLIESLSIFFSSLLHRETLELPVKVSFKKDRLPLDEVAQLVRFQQFNQVSSRPLNESARNKGLQLMLRLVNEIEEAQSNGDSLRVLECRIKLNALTVVLEKNENSRMTRNGLNESDWEIVDQIDFELIQDYFMELTSIFNTEWMSASGIHRELKRGYGINYLEAVVAESLALSFAYIEGLKDTTISLPVFDQQLGKFHLVPFNVKLTTVGDALPCYILEGEDPQMTPWIVVRGSQPCIGISSKNKEYRQGALESILTDALDPQCISGNVINKALISRPIIDNHGELLQTESLSDIFRKWHRQGKSVNLSGHSLGGTIVNALAVEFYDQINTAYAFSAAGVSHHNADRWIELNRLYPDLNLNAKLINFDYEGDIVPSGGRRLIGNHLAIEVQGGGRGIYDTHLQHHLNQNFQIQKVDITKETHNLTRLFCERLRILVGRCFHLLLWLFGKEYVPDWWKNRKVYREGADFERAIRRQL